VRFIAKVMDTEFSLIRQQLSLRTVAIVNIKCSFYKDGRNT